MKINVSFILFTTALFFLAGCSDDLSRREAKRKIREAFNHPRVIDNQLYCGYLKPKPGEVVSETFYGRLEKEGILSFEPYKNDPTALISRLTKKGEKDVIEVLNASENSSTYRMKIAEIDIGEIKGIRNIDDNTCEVEYTWKYTNVTAYGKAISEERKTASYRKREGISAIYEEGEEHFDKVTFTKYDDGWRLPLR